MSDAQPADKLEARVDEPRAKLWLLLDADRRFVTGAVLATVFLTLVAIGTLVPGAVGRIRAGDPVETLFQALVTATITGVTLVLSLNQLVLSQELGDVSDQRDRMRGALSFRRDVADTLDIPVSPARPSQFLKAFVERAGERALTLRETATDDAAHGGAIDDLVGDLVQNARQVSQALAGARFGRFQLVSSALDFNYSWKLHTAQRIRATHGDVLGSEAGEALDGLIEVLELFGPAREHFKTLYFRWELINLSRAILVSAVPALITSVAMLLFLDPSTVTGTVLGVPLVILIVSAAATVALLPFVVLLAYVVRIATVTKHTLSVGPFILRKTDRVEPVEWD